jgi:ketosteroid isomerase-like protein
MDRKREHNEIESFIRAMNRIWTEAWNEEEFRRYIHPDAVAIVPTVPGRLEGRDAYVAGWKGFVEGTEIHEWKETGHRIQTYADGRCAVVTYLFTIRFAMAGQSMTMQGRDMLFLVKEENRWLVAADQFSPEPGL